MSKPYFSRRTIRDSKPIIEYEQDIVNGWTGKYIKAGTTKKYDCTNTTDGDNCDLHYLTRLNSRHPNKKRNRRLLKEFRETGVSYTGQTFLGFDYRWGDINQRRQRKSCEQVANAKRRFKLKQQAHKLIEEGIDEYNREDY